MSRLQMASLEQSNAELTLLSTALTKSRRTTDRMTTLLGEFDDRLARLEKSLLPIHRETDKLGRIQKHLDGVKHSVDALLGHHDLVEREAPLINSDPDPAHLKPYMDSIERLVSASEALRRTNAKEQSVTLAEMSALVDRGAVAICDVVRQRVRENSPVVDAGALYDQGKAFPAPSSEFINDVQPILQWLRGLPVKGANVIEESERAYAEVRGQVMEESLKNTAKEVLVAATTEPPGARSIGRLVDVLVAMAKSEHTILHTVYPAGAATAGRAIYAQILPPSLGLFQTTGSQLNTLVKKSLHAMVPVAFAAFQELQERASEYEDWMRARAGRKDNELGELLHAFRGSCMRSFPEIIDVVKTWGAVRAGNDVGVNSITKHTVAFMRQIAESQPTAETFLGVLGEGNWGGPGSSGDSLVMRYLNDVMATLLTALDSRARLMRAPPRPGMGSIFLLNNLSYVRREILSSQVSDLLGEPCEDELNRKMRTAKSAYLEIWSPLVSALLDAGTEQSTAAGAIKAAVKGGASTERRETKDRFVRFFDAFEEVESLHHAARLDANEHELRERLKDEVDRMVVPTYSKFLARHRHGDFSKNPSKYLRLDAEQLATRIASLLD